MFSNFYGQSLGRSFTIPLFLQLPSNARHQIDLHWKRSYPLSQYCSLYNHLTLASSLTWHMPLSSLVFLLSFLLIYYCDPVRLIGELYVAIQDTIKTLEQQIDPWYLQKEYWIDQLALLLLEYWMNFSEHLYGLWILDFCMAVRRIDFDSVCFLALCWFGIRNLFCLWALKCELAYDIAYQFPFSS